MYQWGEWHTTLDKCYASISEVTAGTSPLPFPFSCYTMSLPDSYTILHNMLYNRSSAFWTYLLNKIRSDMSPQPGLVPSNVLLHSCPLMVICGVPMFRAAILWSNVTKNCRTDREVEEKIKVLLLWQQIFSESSEEETYWWWSTFHLRSVGKRGNLIGQTRLCWQIYKHNHIKGKTSKILRIKLGFVNLPLLKDCLLNVSVERVVL